MNRRTTWRAAGVALAGCFGALAQVAHAQEEDRATLDLDLGAEYSDNITRVVTDEQTETTGIARAALAFEQHRPRLETTINGDLQFRRYMDETYDDEVLGGVSADVLWAILPERFVWEFQDNYGQISSNPLQADTPDNRESFNYFSTGPDITIPFGSRTALLLSGRWSDTYYEDSEEGNESVEGTVGIARQLSEQTTVSLNGSVTDITYDESEIFPDYRITEGYVRMESDGTKTTFSADVGYTQAERDDHTADGPLLRLTISREITSRSTLSLELGSEFADTADAFRVGQTALGVGPEIEDTLAAGDVFRNTYAYLTFDTERERTEFSATIYGSKERHEDEIALDRDLVGAAFSWVRSLTQRMDLDVEGGYTDEKFVTGDVSFHEWSAGAGIGFRFTPVIAMRLSVAHFDGSGDGISRDYEENRAYLGIRYSLGRRGR